MIEEEKKNTNSFRWLLLNLISIDDVLVLGEGEFDLDLDEEDRATFCLSRLRFVWYELSMVTFPRPKQLKNSFCLASSSSSRFAVDVLVASCPKLVINRTLFLADDDVADRDAERDRDRDRLRRRRFDRLLLRLDLELLLLLLLELSSRFLSPFDESFTT